MLPILAAGTVAPNFTLRVTPDQDLTLSDLRGKPVILAFYPADWSPVCGARFADLGVSPISGERSRSPGNSDATWRESRPRS
jgi:hypothetical protein